MKIDSHIGHCVSEWRREAGLSQEALAQTIGLQQTAVSKIEAGKQSLTVEQLLLVLDACGVSDPEALSQLRDGASSSSKPLWERIDE